MAEPKLEEMKKEKLDDIYIDDKELVNKNKKKTKIKGSKKNKPIDLFDYAKENGLDINLQYEEIKQMEFPKEYNKKNDNYKYSNAKKVVNENKNEDTKIENNYEKEDEKEKNNDYKNSKYGNKGHYNKKDYDHEYDNYENKQNNYEYDNYDYKRSDNDYKYNYNYYYEDNNYYNNYNKDNYYGDKRYKNYNNEGNNNYYNYDRSYHYKKNYNTNYNNNYNNNYYNESNYNSHKKKNDIAVELPDPINDKQDTEEKNEESNNNNMNEKNNQNINIKNKVNQMNQMKMYNNMLNYMQANLMSNYQAELMRMNYISNMEHLNSNLYSPYISLIPSTDEGKVELLEKFFSEKNLNKDLNLRKNMDQDSGNVPIDFILNLNKIRSMNLNEETINELINKIGSDIIEIIKQDDKLYLRRRNFEEIKNKLKSVEDMEKEFQQKINKQEQQQNNIQMNPQPIIFYPVQPVMFFGQMMVPSQQRNMPNQSGNSFPVSNTNNSNSISNK